MTATNETYRAGSPKTPANLRFVSPNIIGIRFCLQILNTFLSYESVPLVPGIFSTSGAQITAATGLSMNNKITLIKPNERPL